jgi:hypothetical protein
LRSNGAKAVAFVVAALAWQVAAPPRLAAEPVIVRQPGGLLHGFLVLRDERGQILATGDLSQTVKANRVTAELAFHFTDGSVYRENTIYSQQRVFQLVSYHLIQNGKAFRHSIDFSLDVARGRAKVVETNDDGGKKVYDENLNLPGDLANGLLTTLLLNFDPRAEKITESMVVATPKPRLVKLIVTPSAADSFSIAGAPRKAISYNIKVVIGGAAGIIAPLVGKQPPDTRVWISAGPTPGFLKLEGQLIDGGPIWRIQLASPEWGALASSTLR